ncbi:MAG: 4-coumarate--CoA ligase family protein [Planctomycetota bacterium]
MTIFKSPFPPIEIPDTPLAPFVLRHAQRLGSKPALIDGPSGRTLCYRELGATVQAVSAGLARRGFQKGNVLAIYSRNRPEYAVIFLAVARRGGVTTTINPLYTVEELRAQLRDSRARFLISESEFLAKARPASSGSSLEELFVLEDGARPFAGLADDAKPPPEPEIAPGEDLVTLPYSSGTTGLPKGVMLTYRNLVANVCQYLALGHIGENDRLIGVLPFFHIYGMVVVMLAALHTGATLVTLPRFDLGQFLRVVQEHRISYANLVPPIVLELSRSPLVDEYDLSSLRMISSGAAPLGMDVAQRCSERLNCPVVQGYGLTETSPVTHLTPKERNKPGSIGPPLPNTECKVVGPGAGQELGHGQTGEILIRGPQVMQGYLDSPEATRETIDADGWLHTGDLGYADEDGYFFIVDRIKELIKYKGYQIAPAELEAVLLSHPGIADAAVIPIRDAEAGEVPMAHVVLRHDTSPEEILSFVAERVAPHKKLREISIVDAIPKSASGKILRRVLIQRERKKRSST